MGNIGLAMDWLRGRGQRKAYWIGLLLLIIANRVVAFAVGDEGLASLITAPLWIVVATRRLHDFDASGWWSLSLLVVGFIVGFVMSFVRIAGGLDVQSTLMVTNIIIGLASLGFMIFLGSKPGTPGPNRFGPPPGAQDAAAAFD